ncbi:MAG: hypothetical protein H7X86_06205 [Gorillibacterium sp.]|nr:hypothetical protein [Gorillibacterium sp.]
MLTIGAGVINMDACAEAVQLPDDPIAVYTVLLVGHTCKVALERKTKNGGEGCTQMNRLIKTTITAFLLSMVLNSSAAWAASQVDKLTSNVGLSSSVVSIGGSITLREQESMQAKGVITAIRDVDGYKSIQIQGIDTRGLVLNISADTVIEKADGTKLNFSDLTLGQQIEVEHSMAMTLSLPPQTAAYKIIVMDQSKDEVIGTAGIIEEVRTSADDVTSLFIKGKGLTEKSPAEVVLRLTDSTLLVNPMGDAVKRSEFVQGAQVIGFYSPKLTKSLPPIGTAWKVVLESIAE